MERRYYSSELTFLKCERGFVFKEGYEIQSDTMGRLYAFDRIEDAARWLIDRYVLEQNRG